MFDDNDIRSAARVAKFLMKLCEEQKERWYAVEEKSGVPFPFGDTAYGSALVHWEKCGKPKNSAFSYEEGQIPDPYIDEFKEELMKEFGLRIMGVEEGMKHSKLADVIVKEVRDWGLN